MEDAELTESEVAERISKAQSERSVYKARQGQREKAVTALGAELASALNECSGELRLLVNREVIRRKGIITERVLAALEPVAGGVRREMAIAQLLGFSGSVQRVTVLGPAPYIHTVRDTGLDYTAKDILEKFEQLKAEEGKKL